MDLLLKPRKEAKPLPVKKEVHVLENVFFEVSVTKLLPQSHSELNKLFSLLKDKPTLRIRLEGHTDKIGKVSENLLFSQERVEEVKLYLVKKGIDGDRIEVKGYGEA